MPAIVLSTMELLRVVFPATGDTCQVFATGDTDGLNLWGDGNNATFQVLDAMLTPAANGEIFIANMTSGMYEPALPTGANGVTVTAGAGTLALGMSANGFSKSVEIDLAAGSAGNYEIFSPDVACTLLSVYLRFTTTSGSTPATISVGNSAGSATDYVAAVSSATSAVQFQKQALTLLPSPTVAADTSVYIASDGAGDSGRCVCYIKYRLN
jgi:hypothetical protein